MKTKNFWVLGGMLMVVAFSANNGSADSGAALNSAPIAASDTANLVNKRLANLTRQLGLSADQQANIKPILLDEEPKRQAILGDATQTVAGRREKLQELRDATDSLMRPILTAQQLATRDALVKAIAERNRQLQAK